MSMMSIKHLSLDDTRTPILKACTDKDLLKNDRISDLPDDILVSIISLLTLKEAGSTSVLSKRWRHVWAYVPSLIFYPCLEYMKELRLRNASRSEVNEKQREEDIKHFHWVDQVVTSHKADFIDEFKVKFNLSPEEYKENIDNWFRFAMLKRVKRLELDLYPRRIDNVFYKLPSLSPSVPLTSLQLNYVNVTGEALEKLLHESPTLEFLSVGFSISLGNLKVAGPALKLKSLKIDRCSNIKHLEISAPNLISFDYRGDRLSSFPLISTPKLTELSIRNHYAGQFLENFMDLSSIFSQLEVFNLESYRLWARISQEFPVGPRMKTLSIFLDVRILEKLFLLISLIHGCPLLERFFLQRQRGEFYPRLEKMERIEACPHQHLKIVEINDYFGCEEEFSFVEHLIEMAIPLENIIIRATRKPEEDTRRALEEANRLHEVLKPGVHLEIY